MKSKLSALLISFVFTVSGFAIPVSAEVETLASDPPTISDIAAGGVRLPVGTQTYIQDISDDNTLPGEWGVSVVSSNPSIATAVSTVASDGATVETVITPVAGGYITITITIADVDGLTASDSYDFIVAMNDPSAVRSVSSKSLEFSRGANADDYIIRNSSGNGWRNSLLPIGSYQLYVCDSATSFLSTRTQAFSVSVDDSSIGAFQPELDSNGCITFGDQLDLSTTSSTLSWPEYTLENYETVLQQVGPKRYLTLYSTEDAGSGVSTTSLADGLYLWDRPATSGEISVTGSGSSYTATTATLTGGSVTSDQGWFVCEESVVGGFERDYDYPNNLDSNGWFGGKCQELYDSGNSPISSTALDLSSAKVFDRSLPGEGGDYRELATEDGLQVVFMQRLDHIWQWSDSAELTAQGGGTIAAPRPFQGPVITDVGADNTVSPFPTSIGNNVRVLGQKLSGVSSVLVNGIETELLSKSENSFVFTVPEGLESGTYELTVVSGGQNVQVQEPLVIGDGLSIEEAAAICDGQAPTVWTQRISLTQAKAYIKCGTPGVSYRVSVQQNGSGPYDTVITRTLTDIYDERQLFNTVGRYVVRTIDLTDRTRIRIYANEEKLWQVVYNKDSFGG